jgi:signal transduction histidine kinase
MPGRRAAAVVGAPALAAALGVLFLVDARSGTSDQQLPLFAELAVAAVACAALVLARRRPVTVAAVLLPAVVVSAATLGATAAAVGAVARHRSWRAAVAVLALHTCLVAFLFAVAGASRRDYWQGLAVVLALDVAFVAWGLFARAQHELVATLRQRADDAERLHRLRVDEARHAERTRIAREMHDVLAHHLSLVAVHAGALEVRRSAPPEDRRSAGIVRAAAANAVQELHAVIGMLRDPGEDEADVPQPTLAGLPALVEECRQAGTDVVLGDSSQGRPIAVPPDVGRHAYRIGQEALTNARKHAPGAPVRVVLSSERRAEPELVIDVRNPVDDGAGPGRPGPGGTGLIGLRERVDLVGGCLEHRVTPEGEFVLRARLPLRG